MMITLTVLSNCESKFIIDSEVYTNKIIKLQVDEFGNVLDTSSIYYIKYNEERGIEKEKEIINISDKQLVSKKEYDNDGELIYQKTEFVDDLSFSEFQVFKDSSGRIYRAVMINMIDSGFIDTVEMKYNWIYDQNRLNQLVVVNTQSLTRTGYSKTTFDDNENKIHSVFVSTGDTLTIDKWEYNKNNELIKGIHDDYIFGRTRTTSNFVEGKLTDESKIDLTNGHLIKQTTITYSKQREIETMVEVFNGGSHYRYFIYRRLPQDY